ncbi:hypothetical protein SteCoe_32502 [Stentor coeruleus]|uniref:Uncharacterized protein n=1 Tax=Stentor coeruleus TaxID=5963 RepID=A0A1R2AYU7_9CILI|nr:hypothetical protein SteCoe_32502 [Stentor coeruleus]
MENQTLQRSQTVNQIAYSPYKNQFLRIVSSKQMQKRLIVRAQSKKHISSSSLSSFSSIFTSSGKNPKILDEKIIVTKQIGDSYLEELKKKLEERTSPAPICEIRIYFEFLDEIIDFLKPLSPVLQTIKSGLFNLMEEKTENHEWKAKYKIIEKSNQKLSKSLELLQKDKQLLIKKLNKSVSIIEELTCLTKKQLLEIDDLKKKCSSNPDRFLDYDNVIDNLLRQSSTICNQNQVIKELSLNEIKLKKVVQKISLSGYAVEKIINEVDKEIKNGD